MGTGGERGRGGGMPDSVGTGGGGGGGGGIPESVGTGGGGGGGGIPDSVGTGGGGGGGGGTKKAKNGSGGGGTKQAKSQGHGGGGILDSLGTGGGGGDRCNSKENNRFEGMKVLFLGTESESNMYLKEITERGGIVIPMADHNHATHICIDDDKKVLRKDWLRRVLFDGEELTDEANDLVKKNHQLFLCDEDLSSLENFDAYLEKRKKHLISTVLVEGSSGQFSFRTNTQLKIIIGRLYVLMKTLHKLGFSLRGIFSTRNFVIDEAKMEKNVRFSNIQSSDLRFCTPENAMLDLARLNEMVRQEVFYLDITPHDLNIWLALMMDPEFEDLMPIHVSLLDDLCAGEKLSSCYETLKNLKKRRPDEFSRIITNLKAYSNWKEVIRSSDGNQFMQGTLSYGDNHHIPYDDDAFGLLKLIRNCRQHQAREYFRVFIIIVSHNFPNLASDLQKELFKGGHL